MRRPRHLSTLIAAGAIVLGGGTVALAQAGGPPDDVPAAPGQPDRDGPPVDLLELVPETATGGVDGDNAEAFSAWVRSLDEVVGCQRGLTIAAAARQGPTTFDPADAPEPVAAEDLPGRCGEAGGGEGFGRATAAAASGGRSGGTGAPDHAGRPEGVGAPEDAGAPDDRGAPEGVGAPEDTGPPEDAGAPDDRGAPEGLGAPEGAGPPAGTPGPR